VFPGAESKEVIISFDNDLGYPSGALRSVELSRPIKAKNQDKHLLVDGRKTPAL
jgi:hypothetical protein